MSRIKFVGPNDILMRCDLRKKTIPVLVFLRTGIPMRDFVMPQPAKMPVSPI